MGLPTTRLYARQLPLEELHVSSVKSETHCFERVLPLILLHFTD